jgi:hypothetical protein
MKNIHLILVCLSLVLAISSCKDKKEDTPSPNTNPGSIKIEMNHVWNNIAFSLNTDYTTNLGQVVNINKFKYYISNISLKKSDGTYYNIPDSYYLIDGSTSQTLFELTNIPAADYTGIKMMIGVDSARNVSGAQTGALDPANNMFWTWSSGYIMLKMEGSSPSASGGSFTFHNGGYAGSNAVQRWFEDDFASDVADINAETSHTVDMRINVAEFFTGPTDLDLSVLSFNMATGSTASAIADRYSDMIEVDHLHQE